MFTANAIKNEIKQKLGWDKAGLILEIDSPEVFFDRSPDWKIRDAFSKLLFSSSEARQKLLLFSPSDAIINILSDSDMRYLVGSGAKDAFLVDSLIAQYHPSSMDVLDFGCGSGRLLRFLAQFSSERTYFGCDVISGAVEHLRESGIPGTFQYMQSAPPAPFAECSFDAIFAWSIFSHYAEDLHWQWLIDLRRMLRPGGLLLATFHNRESIDTQRNDERVRERIDFDSVEKGYMAGKFMFSPIYKYFNLNGLDEDNFGQAFFPASYIRMHWSELFDVIDIISAVQGWQDMAILRRR